MPGLKIKKNDQENSIEVYASKKIRNKIIKLLASEPCYCKLERSVSGSFLRLDYHALEILKYHEYISLELNDKLADMGLDIAEGLKQENALAKILETKHYNLPHRIWANPDQTTFFTKVNHRIYSGDLEAIIGLVDGTYLITTHKPPSHLNLHPIGAFGIANELYAVASSDKSVLRPINPNKAKKNYRPVIPNIYVPPSLLGLGANVIDVTMGVGLPSYVSTNIQALLIWPVLLKGAYIGYDDLVKEANFVHGKSDRAPIDLAIIDEELNTFKEKLCKMVGISYDDSINDAPQVFLEKITNKLSQDLQALNSKEESDKAAKAINKIIKLCSKYQKSIIEKNSQAGITDVAMAYCNLLVTVGIISSAVFHEATNAAEAEIFRNIASLSDYTSSVHAIEKIFSYTGGIGHLLASAYNFYNIGVEKKSRNKASEELEKFKDVKNVSELAKSISTTILSSTKKNHSAKMLARLFLGIGELAIGVGSEALLANPGIIASTLGVSAVLSPIFTYTGVGLATAGAIGVKAADIIFKNRYPFDDNPDAAAQVILKKFPEFNNTKPSDSLKLNARELISKHVQRQTFALEVLGHLRETQFILYKKFLEKNDDCQGITEKFLLSGKGVGLIKKNSEINKDLDQCLKQFGNNVNILEVKGSDIENFIWPLSAHLSSLHDLKDGGDISSLEKIIDEVNLILGDKKIKLTPNQTNIDQIHKNIIIAVQQAFINKRLEPAGTQKLENKDNPLTKIEEEARNLKNTLEICKKILAGKSSGSWYLQEKILRAVDEGKLKYKDGLLPVKKNVKVEIVGTNPKEKVEAYFTHKIIYGEVEIVKFDLDEFDQNGLIKLLNKKRPPKNFRRLIPHQLTEHLAEKHPDSIVRKLTPSHQKRSVLETAIAKELAHIKAQYFRPFSDISETNTANKIFEETKNKKEETARERKFTEEILGPMNKIHASHPNKPIMVPNEISITSTKEQSKLLEELEKIAAQKISTNKEEILEPMKKIHASHPIKPIIVPNEISITSTKEQSKLLEELEKIAAQKISTNKSERVTQIKNQNEIIGNIIKKAKPFILKPTTKNNNKRESIFIYESPTNPGSKDHEIIYIRNNKNGEIKVIYGPKAEAIIAQKAEQTRNAFVVTLSNNKIKKFGDEKNSIFGEFEARSRMDENLGVSPKPLKATALMNNKERKRERSQHSANSYAFAR